ncbi:MAG: energy transducer TonB [Mediterranea sp.]|nr:energy transducer TonB [Mediterranea sp.]
MQENRNALCTIDSVAPKGKEKPDDGTIFDRYYYERMPEFLGGQTKLMKYIDSCVVSFLSPLDKVNYPQGRVIVQFLVEADGSITHAKVMRGVHPDLDKEALRIINAMPKWRPGEVNGKKTAVKFTAPIIFKRPTK